MESETSYPPDFVTYLEMQWGIGFLSPGGRDEVLEILRDVKVEGGTVLDVGCGAGGPALVIAKSLRPRRIVGIDIEPHLIELASRNVAAAGLEQVVELQCVTPGPFSFPDQTFDVAFSKDSLIHIADKLALYREVLRVLRPGGLFAASDWLSGEGAGDLEGYKAWRALTPHGFTMRTCEETRRDLVSAGFADVVMRDRNEWYAETARQEVRVMESETWRDRFVAALGEEAYEGKLTLRTANARAAECGGLRPTHMFGRRPMPID